MDIQNIHRVYNEDKREQFCIFSLMKKIINYERKWYNYVEQMEKYYFPEIFYASCGRERGRTMKKLISPLKANRLINLITEGYDDHFFLKHDY